MNDKKGKARATRSICIMLYLLLIADTALAQEYVPFVEAGKDWYVVQFTMRRYGFALADGADYCGHTFFNHQGDRDFDGHTYKLMHQGDSYIPDVEYTDEVCKYETRQKVRLYFREENGRVYRYDTVTAKEHLVYDFTVKVGDEFDHHPYPWIEAQPFHCTVTAIDTVCIGDKSLKSIHLKVSSVIHYDDGTSAIQAWEEQWIEGIGNPHCMQFGLGIDPQNTSTAYMVRKLEEDDQCEYFPFNVQNYAYHSMPLYAEGVQSYEGPMMQLSVEDDKLRVKGYIYQSHAPYKYVECTTTDDLGIALISHEVGQACDHGELLPIDTLFDVLTKPGTYSLNYHGKTYTVNYKCEPPTAISHPQQGISNLPFTLYDLQGRKVEAKPGKGIYIKDGKKYMMK